MGSFQELVGQVGKGVKIAVEFISQAASRLLTTASEKAEAVPSEKLTQLVTRASEALQGRVESTSGAATTIQKTPLGIAQAMLDSYQFDRKTGVSTFTVPAGVTDVEAMRALNEYQRKLSGREAVCEQTFPFFERVSDILPVSCPPRNYSQARQITITGVVQGTKDKDRPSQGRVLSGKSLVFADPRDQAIAAALHACKHEGEDLFQKLWVRCSVPGVLLGYAPRTGVFVCVGYNPEGGVAASGSPSPADKKT